MYNDRRPLVWEEILQERKKNSDASDSELLERALNGNRIAMIEFAMAHCDKRLRRRVDRQLRRAGITIVDSDDVFDSAGRRLLLRCEKTGAIFSDCGHIVAYITETVMNVMREKIRRERRRRLVLDGYKRVLARRTGQVTEAELASAIESVVSRLSPEDQRVLKLRLRGLSHKQAADELSLPVGAFRDRWRRVRTCMLDLLEA